MNLSEQYYEKGYIKTKIHPLLKARLWNEVYNTEWTPDDIENLYKQVPSWYKSDIDFQLNKDGSNRAEYERLIGEDIYAKTPQSLFDIGNELVRTDPFSFLWPFYKTAELKYIDMWNGSEGIGFHHDAVNGCDTLALIYLTDQPRWDDDWGGTIEMKKRIDGKDMYYQKVQPLDGTMMIINNANPHIYHRVTALTNTDVDRYTFSFIYKWL